MHCHWMHHILNIYIIDLKNDVINPENKKMDDQRRFFFTKGIKPSKRNYRISDLCSQVSHFKQRWELGSWKINSGKFGVNELVTSFTFYLRAESSNISIMEWGTIIVPQSIIDILVFCSALWDKRTKNSHYVLGLPRINHTA